MATITWHWGMDEKQVVHARLEGKETSICGDATEDQPLMRPPFPAVQCPTCREHTEGFTRVFPNLYPKL